MLELNKQKLLWLGLAIVVLGAFLRLYNFAPWLHFELDQARDAMVVDAALDGNAADLPLLGPKAAGTFLRLGPAFYYIQYVGGLVFGQTPQGIAYPMAIFSILTIPLVYLVFRKLFGQAIALGLSLVAAVSVFLIFYGRFAWNPNAIPFFLLASFYGLLRATGGSEKYPGRWLALAALALAIATQLHFLVFLVLPPTAVLYLLIKRPRLSWKAWAGSLMIVMIVYLPVIINDSLTGGASVREFTKALTDKSEKKAEGHVLPEQVIRAYTEAARGSFLLVSGLEQTELPAVKLRTAEGGWGVDVKCDQGCRSGLGWGVLALGFFTGGLALVVFSYVQHREKAPRSVLLLGAIWTLMVLGLFVPLAFDIAPRFMLLLVPVAFLLLGVWAEFLTKIFAKHKIIALTILVALLAVSNLLTSARRFGELAKAMTQTVDAPGDRILKERDRVTLAQQLAIAAVFAQAHKENGQIVYLNSEPHYRRALLYHVRRQNIPYEDFRNAKVYREGNYFLVHPTNASLENKVAKYLDNYNEKRRINFGTLTLVQLTPLKDKIVAERQIMETKPPAKKKSAPGVPVRYTWREAFAGMGGEEDQADEEGEESL